MPDGADRDSVLITRPEPGAEETARRIAAMGFVPVLAPLLRIQPVTCQDGITPGPGMAAVLATSRNAIPALHRFDKRMPVLAVGDATAATARQCGFENVLSASGNAAALADLARGHLLPGAGSLLLVTGRGQGRELRTALEASGFCVVRREVYEAVPVEALPEAASAALRGRRLRAALFFSAETARCFVRLAQDAGVADSVHAVEAVAIGPAAGVALEALPWRQIAVATKPNQTEMLALLR